MKVSEQNYKELVTDSKKINVHLSGMYSLILDMARDLDTMFDSDTLTPKKVADIFSKNELRSELIDIISVLNKKHEEMFGDFENCLVKDMDKVDGAVLDDENSVEKAKSNGYNPMMKELVPPIDVDIIVLFNDLTFANGKFVNIGGTQGFSVRKDEAPNHKGKNVEVIGWKLA
jgi:RNAse (barnase) inhibitor barstar